MQSETCSTQRVAASRLAVSCSMPTRRDHRKYEVSWRTYEAKMALRPLFDDGVVQTAFTKL